MMSASGITLAAESGFSFKTLLMPDKVIEGHAKYERSCNRCHQSGSDETQANLCLDCHEDVATDVVKKQGFHGRISGEKNNECDTCHTEHIGRQGDIVNLDPSNFNHQQTDFELTGKHTSLACSSCHEPGAKFREASGSCFSCHQQDDQHQTVLGENCANCHSEISWRETQFNHDDTQFNLRGGHQKVQCNACHPDEKYVDTPTLCFSCHAINDVHNAVNGEQCQDCHNETSWQELSFDHDTDTNFALRGEHASISCSACHQQSGFKEALSTRCIDCHANDDEHNSQNGEQCNNCHNETRWNKILFNHNLDTEFVLHGKHAELQCDSCHRNGTSNSQLGTACIDCHQIDDVHKGQQGNQCDSCHNQSGWLNKIRFNHDLTTFPLVGMHAVTSCDSCHISKVFSDAEKSCVDCHQQDDSHKRALGPDCGSCHNPNDWQLWIFDHETQTNFQLDGAHQGLSCNECHRKRVKQQVKQSASCAACHLNDDVHNRRFGRDCKRCHTTDVFKSIKVQ